MCKIDWKVEQFRHLEQEKRQFDRYMWQIPVATMGVVAIVLGVVRNCTSVGSNSTCGVSRGVIIILCGLVVYSVLLLCRLLRRRKHRLKLMENLIPENEFVLWDIKVTEFGRLPNCMMWCSNFLVNYFGWISTTFLGVLFLSILLIMLLVLFFLIPLNLL